MRDSLRYFTLSVIAVVCLASGTLLMAEGTTITLLHVNDTHSHLDATGPKDARLNGTIGGLAKAATIIARTRATDPNVLLLHAGDVFHGDFFFNKYFGVPEFQLMRQLGFDAMAVGNHEFDFGPDVLSYSLTQAFGASTLPLLSANLDFGPKQELNTWIKQNLIKEIGGLKIGVFGMTIPGVPTSQPEPVKILGGDDPTVLIGIAAMQAAMLRNQGADVVICLSHLGYLYDQAVATYAPGIDIIVGGHDHYVVEQPLKFGNTIYVQAGMHYEYVGRMHFTVPSKGVVMVKDYSLLSVDKPVPPLPEAQAVVDQLKAGIVAQYGDVYHSPFAFALADIEMTFDPKRPTRDTGMGNLITDAMREHTHTDLAITPNALISEGISHGFIVGADVFRPVSFGYDPSTGLGLPLATFQMTGKDLITSFEFGLSYLGINEDYILQVSGMRFAYDPVRPIGQRIILSTVFIAGKSLNPSRLYSVTVNGGLVALLGQLSPLLGITAKNIQILPDLEYNVLKNYITHHPILFYSSQYRIVEWSNQIGRMPFLLESPQ